MKNMITEHLLPRASAEKKHKKHSAGFHDCSPVPISKFYDTILHIIMSKINDAAQVQLIAAVGWFGSMEPPLGTELSGEVGLSAQFEGYRGNTPVPYSGTERKNMLHWSWLYTANLPSLNTVQFIWACLSSFRTYISESWPRADLFNTLTGSTMFNVHP